RVPQLAQLAAPVDARVHRDLVAALLGVAVDPLGGLAQVAPLAAHHGESEERLRARPRRPPSLLLLAARRRERVLLVGARRLRPLLLRRPPIYPAARLAH